MNQYATESSAGRLIVTWALVAIPLAWGIYHTLLAAAKLFGL
ncbi:MAG TPA: hypothetical protein VFN77_08760 [Acetobacteraceae bacterium]|nr:hypothetical protein [Acetobacteraceae bacterium]